MRNTRERRHAEERNRGEYGVGFASAHHGELLQGIFTDGEGRLRRGLVTLPQTDRGSRATFYPSHHHWGIIGTSELVKVRRAAILALREFAAHPQAPKGGLIEIISDVPTGIGMGSSTSDVTATIRAVADYHHATLSREEVGRLAVAAECASDSIMIDDRVVLFAHRDGVVIETFGHQLPPMIVVGCDTAPGTRVDTLGMRPAEYDDDEVAAFRVLRGGMRRAVATGDIGLIGRVATASSVINQRHLPKPAFEALLELCAHHGGQGVQVAHSGTIAGVIFDATDPATPAAARRCAADIEAMGLVLTAVATLADVEAVAS